jgi:hypothetical protein
MGAADPGVPVDEREQPKLLMDIERCVTASSARELFGSPLAST